MLQNYSRYRVLQEFFDYPRKHFQVRELSRTVRLAQVSIANHLHALQKEGLVVKEKKGLYPSFRANKESEKFKLLKQQNLRWRLHVSGLIQQLEEKTKPNCIALFGSASRGEDTEMSDIDLFVQAKEVSLHVGRTERALRRKVNLLFEPDLKQLSKELLNNIINGQVLEGYLKVM